jgi:hypothetical protein
MAPSEKCLGEFPELLQVGGLPRIITTLGLALPIQRFSQENLTSTLNQTGPYILYLAISRDEKG